MTKRYYLATPPTGERALLEGPEAHHLLHVMRAEVGDEVTLFDGTGSQFPARVAERFRDCVELEVGPKEEVDRELPIELIVGVALPKGDRQKWLVEKLTELGVVELVPLVTDRGVADLRSKSLDRLQRSVVEASKQCGRNRLMQISGPTKLSDFFDRAGERRLLAHPSGRPVGETLEGSAQPTMVAIGPEGGWADDEVGAAAQRGWSVVSLGASILRVETAAIAITALLANR